RTFTTTMRAAARPSGVNLPLPCRCERNLRPPICSTDRSLNPVPGIAGFRFVRVHPTTNSDGNLAKRRNSLREQSGKRCEVKKIRDTQLVRHPGNSLFPPRTYQYY